MNALLFVIKFTSVRFAHVTAESLVDTGTYKLLGSKFLQLRSDPLENYNAPYCYL